MPAIFILCTKAQLTGIFDTCLFINICGVPTVLGTAGTIMHKADSVPAQHWLPVPHCVSEGMELQRRDLLPLAKPFGG